MAYLHSIEHAQGLLRTSIISVLTEAEATRVVLARLFDEMEALKSPVPLEQVLDLVLGVLLGQTSDEELAWAVVYLG